MTSQDFESLYKLLIIGNSGVGKTCIMTRFVDDCFEKSLLNTIGVDFKTKVVTVGKRKIKLQIWDTAGHERFKTITSAFYRGALGILVVYDITDRSSFNEVQQWMDNINQKCGGDEPYVVLVGNKCDLEDRREISQEEGRLVADHFQCKFFETSALKTINVTESSQVLAVSTAQQETRPRGMTIERQSPPGQKSSKCCSS